MASCACIHWCSAVGLLIFHEISFLSELGGHTFVLEEQVRTQVESMVIKILLWDPLACVVFSVSPRRQDLALIHYPPTHKPFSFKDFSLWLNKVLMEGDKSMWLEQVISPFYRHFKVICYMSHSQFPHYLWQIEIGQAAASQMGFPVDVSESSKASDSEGESTGVQMAWNSNGGPLACWFTQPRVWQSDRHRQVMVVEDKVNISSPSLITSHFPQAGTLCPVFLLQISEMWSSDSEVWTFLAVKVSFYTGRKRGCCKVLHASDIGGVVSVVGFLILLQVLEEIFVSRGNIWVLFEICGSVEGGPHKPTWEKSHLWER